MGSIRKIKTIENTEFKNVFKITYEDYLKDKQVYIDKNSIFESQDDAENELYKRLSKQYDFYKNQLNTKDDMINFTLKYGLFGLGEKSFYR